MKLTYEEKIAIRVSVKYTLQMYRDYFWNNVEQYRNANNKTDKQNALYRCTFWNREAVELKKVLEKII